MLRQHAKMTKTRMLLSTGLVVMCAVAFLIGGGSLYQRSAKSMQQAYTVDNCVPATRQADIDYCEDVGAPVLCEHTAPGNLPEKLTCCDGARADQVITDISDAATCEQECIERYYDAWHNSQSLPLELTVDGRLESDGCHCVDLFCVIDYDEDVMQPAAEAEVRAQLDEMIAHVQLHADSHGADDKVAICGTDEAFVQEISSDKQAYEHAVASLARVKTDATHGDLPDGCKYHVPVRFVSDGRLTDAEAAAEIVRANQIIQGQMALSNTFLNDWSIGTEFELVLAENAVDANVPASCRDTDRGTAVLPAAVRPEKQLNVMICNDVQSNTGELVGVAVFPWSPSANGDGDVILMSGSLMPNYLFALAHEMGHSLGLWHTFQNYCNGAGDEVGDTPAEGPVGGGPDRTCDENVGGCAGAQRMAENVMSYTDCPNRGISEGQRLRILAHGAANEERAGLHTTVCDDYVLVEQAAAFDDARAFCQQTFSSDLALVDSAARNTQMSNTLSASGSNSAWIGLSDSATEGTFRWITEQMPSYTQFHLGEPNAVYPNEDCINMGTYLWGNWMDSRCNMVFSFFCSVAAQNAPANHIFTP